MNRFTFVSVVLLVLLTSCKSNEEIDLSNFFGSSKGSFVLYDYQNNKYIRYNSELAADRFTPASTFKILNSLIGLETGVVKNENEVFKWDGTEYKTMKDWNRDHDMTSAIKYSVVWFYQELAKRIGEERMKYYIDTVNYGNKDISGGIDVFWLKGNLKISAGEQVEFLKKLHEDSLPFSQHTMDIVKSILPGENGEGYKLRAKTGLNNLDENNFIGWYVGYVYTNDNTYVFALNIIDADADTVRNGRIEITKNILKHFGII